MQTRSRSDDYRKTNTYQCQWAPGCEEMPVWVSLTCSMRQGFCGRQHFELVSACRSTGMTEWQGQLKVRLRTPHCYQQHLCGFGPLVSFKLSFFFNLAKAGLQPSILLHPFSQCYNYRCTGPSWDNTFFFFCLLVLFSETRFPFVVLAVLERTRPGWDLPLPRKCWD